MLEIFIGCQINLFLILQHLMKNSLNFGHFAYQRTPTHLCKHFNIDLLKIRQKPNYGTLYYNLISSGLLPRISLPTRLTDHSATLIDNIFSTVLDDHKSAVIVNTISDHQMIYTYSIEKNICH